jgi:hypothetical protein
LNESATRILARPQMPLVSPFDLDDGGEQPLIV